MRKILHRMVADNAYLLLGFPLALTAFSLLITGFFTGAFLAIIWVGVPVLALTLQTARWIADLERVRIAGVLGRPLARPRYAGAPDGAGWLRQMANPLFSGQTWLDLAHAVVVFPVAVVTFCVMASWWFGTLLGLTFPLYGWSLRSAPDAPGQVMNGIGGVNLSVHGYQELSQQLGLGSGFALNAVLYLAIGLFFAVTMYPVARGCALLQASVGRLLLSKVAELYGRIDDLTEGRNAAAHAEANALRRLERDIHDGPQQRLVHLAMELSRAQRELKKDADAAQATIGQAIVATRETLDELRALSRGIAPPILADRGLSPALAALASRCTVPVELDVQVEERFPALIENTVYFVTAEALTNVAKHSRASMCAVSLVKIGDTLLLTIGDDGVGGAHVSKGHGLSGLADRLRAVDGTLTVRSPAGGPTSIMAEVPCG
jgi:signal transduction histidine kinase